MKIAIVISPNFEFSDVKPRSVETVIRNLHGHDKTDEVTVFCQAGAESHGHMNVIEVPQSKTLSGYVKNITAALKAYHPVRAPSNIIDRWRLSGRYRVFAGFIFVSDAIRNLFCQGYPDLADKSFTVHNPIDADQWRGSADQKDNVIIFCGRPSPEKGFGPLCEALGETLPDYPDWTAVLILGGYEKTAAWAEAQINHLNNVTDQVTILKNQPLEAVKPYMQTAAIAVVPSIWTDPFPLSALEAMASGCALISSGRGGLREASGDHALYLDDVTPSHISQALKHIMDSPSRRQQLAASGQSHTRQFNTISACLSDLKSAQTAIMALPKL